MRYNPEAAEQMFPAGQYAATVKVAKEKTSKGGNDMIELILTCYDASGRQVDVFDYLLSTDQWQWKVRHFCESAGLDYKKGELNAEDCVDQNVRVNLKIDKQEGYADKNAVSDYLPRATDVRVEPVAPKQDDDIPF